MSMLNGVMINTMILVSEVLSEVLSVLSIGTIVVCITPF